MSKKLVCALLILIAICAALPRGVNAEAAEYSWARITKDGVYLFADEACSKMLFQLEKSYYVEILATLTNVYQVTVMQGGASGFPSIMGYVRKIEAKECEVAPLSPVYPTEQIYVTTDSAQLRLLPTTSAEIVIVATTTQRLSYYGSLSYYGKNWYYVYCGGRFGYVDASNVSKPAIELHPTPLETAQPVVNPQQPVDDNPPDETPSNAMPASEILLIVFVVLIAIGLTLALFLPANGKKSEVFESDI